MDKLGQLIKERTPGGTSASVPSYNSNILQMIEGTIKDYRVFDNTLQITVYLADGKVYGGKTFVEDHWEEGAWIPYMQSLLTALGTDGPIRTGQKVVIFYPQDNIQNGMAIRCQGRGLIASDSDAMPTEPSGLFFSCGSW